MDGFGHGAVLVDTRYSAKLTAFCTQHSVPTFMICM